MRGGVISAMARALGCHLGRHLVRIMPPSRADWAQGMKAEIDTIEDPAAALSFALGCVGVGYRRRLRTLPGVLAFARGSVGVAIMVFAVFVFASACGFTTLETPGILPQVATGLGLAFLTAGLALLGRGPVALAGVATGMLGLNALALWASSQTALPHGDVHRALILEGYVLWPLLVGVGMALHICGRSSRLATFADRRGWTG